MLKSQNSHLTEKYLSNFKARDLIEAYCDYCFKSFKRRKNNLVNKHKNILCSMSCVAKYNHKSIKVKCLNCFVAFYKRPSNLKKCPNSFCSRSCAATYNNTHKTKGIRVSKLEVWIANQPPKLYPNLEIDYNLTSAINMELDIFIPSLNLAFEINGIFHYKPIFGENKLQTIIRNDNKKSYLCKQSNIKLISINTSSQIRFTEKSSQQYLQLIIDYINLYLSLLLSENKI